jgi:hypothetical protein
MNSDEIQSAIEFLLKSQANFEVQLEKTNRQLERTDQQAEETNQRISLLAETQTEFIQTILRHVEDQRALNAGMRQTMRELAQAQQLTQQGLSELSEAQQLTRRDISDLAQAQQRTQQEISDLAQAQQRTQQEISDLTKIVGGLVKIVYEDGNPPQA